MAGFEEYIVREYFEQHGFLGRHHRRSPLGGRRKGSEESIDFVVVNPDFAPSDRQTAFLLFTSELVYLEQAVVLPRMWHRGVRLSPALFKNNTELLKFIEKHVRKEMEIYNEELATRSEWIDWKRILVLPSLPTSEPQRTECTDLLRNMGLHGIISFRTMLMDVINKLEITGSYDKSPFLDVLRVLKAYDLLKESQMGLFKEGAP